MACDHFYFDSWTQTVEKSENFKEISRNSMSVKLLARVSIFIENFALARKKFVKACYSQWTWKSIKRELELRTKQNQVRARLSYVS